LRFGGGSVGKGLAFVCMIFIPVVFLASAVPQAREKPTSRAARYNPAEFKQIAKQAGEARDANRMDLATGLYQKALKLNPRWDEGWWYLGTLFYDSNKYAECSGAFRHLVQISPDYGSGWALLGLCEFELRDYKNSYIHLQRGRAKGLGDNRDLVNAARYHQALIEILNGNFEDAKFLLSSLVTQNVLSNNVKQAMGLAFLHVPLLPSEIDPTKDALISAAGNVGELEALNDMDEAKDAMAQLAKDYPSTPFVHYSYGELLTQLSKYKEAEAELLAEIKINPESAMPLMQLAYIYTRLDEFKDALAPAQKAVQMAPQSFAAHYLLGRTLLGVGRINEAITELTIAKRLGPFSPEVRYNLARALSRAKRPAEAAMEAAEFERLNKLAQQSQQKSRPLSYRDSGDRGASAPSQNAEPPDPGPPQF
jgi:tetratricopeptide (TPR) repeat protein